MKNYNQLVEVDHRAKGVITVLDFEGLATKEVVVGENTLVEGTDFDAETSNAVTATNIADALSAATDVTAVAVGDVVNVFAIASGTGGNSLALTTDADAEALTVSGAGTLAGGVAESYSPIIDLSPELTLAGISTVAYLTEVEGDTPEITAVLQMSADGNAWIDLEEELPAFTAANVPSTKYNYPPGPLLRAKITVTGDSVRGKLKLAGMC